MKKIVSLWVVGVLGALVISGCANERVVKKDEAMTPSATSQTKQSDAKSVKEVPAKASTTIPDIQTADIAKKGMATSESQMKEELKSALEKIYFDFDSYDLSEQARKTLTNNADYLSKNAANKLQIEGNCDERGSAEYNLALGEKRANAAKKYLVTLGVAESRIASVSYGKEKPVNQGHDESAWAKNRRDEFIILSK